MAGTTSELSPGGLFSSDTTTQAGSISESAASAATDATAEQSQLAAAASETAAAASATTASTKASEASTSASTATTKASEASTSATNAAGSATTASGHATTATTKASEAAASATTATTKASEAATSATNAATSASGASTSATNASTSASTASGHKDTATTKASEASTSATNAATSASTASGHKDTATTKASEAATSATNAASSATTASGHKDTATTKASEAATSATNAATSASTASTQATNASNSASTSTTKASEAATSATNAASSATSAASSATAAQTAQAATELAFDNFDDKFLGTKSSDPSADNDGNTLAEGAMYYNSGSNVIKFYNGSSWEAPSTAASNSATASATSATNAATSASAAATSATNAASSASTASGHKDTATTKASEAATSATNAASSASGASSSASTATTKASEASTSATNAASSATAAASSATAAASSATAAAGSATTASGHKDTATTKASEAATSATNAANSATTASTQATNSSNSASTASTQATTATNKAADAGKYAVHAEDSQFTLSDGSTTGYSALHWNAKAEDQKTAAATSATNAASSATAAASSATAAAGSATTASTQATNASNSASTATTQANTATTQASTATTKASEAATSATNSASSASTASTQATNSSNSASSSATAQAASEAARDAALAALDSFDDRYLGVKSSAPSVDNDGNALVQGALYFDSGTDSMKVYDGSNWLNAYASLSGALIASNNLSDLNNAGTARTNLGVAIGSNVQAHSSVLDGTQQSFTTALKNKLDGVATSANAYVHPNHSGEVTSTADGATVIADNIVDEANLKVSNTPTNGYFLSAQSGNTGGLTWAVPTDTQYSVGDGGLTQNNFTDADHSKLNGIEASATADQTDAEIRAAVEAATDSNVFTDADHTKLNGIEASATADQTAAEIRTLVEGASDSNVFTDADHSKLDAIEASADVTDATNVTAAGALMDSEVTNLAQVKAFASSDYATAAQGTTADAALPKAGGTLTGDLILGDNVKLEIGSASGGDLQIYHDGSNSYIKDAGTGDLILEGSADVVLKGTDSNVLLRANSNSSVQVYHNGSEKLATTSSGTSTTGNIVVSGTVDGRDVATDGTKLDGIEANATADQSNAEIKTAVEAATDIALGGSPTTTTQAESDDSTKIATTAYVTDKITTLIGGAPSTLNDLNELAAAINDDANYNSTLTTALGTKLPKAGGTMTGAIEMGSNAITSAGNLSLDVAGYVDIDADDGGVYFTDGGTTFGRIYNNSSNLRIKSQIGDKDISFEGVDGSSAITALTLDMSAGGNAIFNDLIKTGNLSIGSQEIDVSSGNLTLDVAGDITLDADGGSIHLHNGGTDYGQINLSSNNIDFHSEISDGDIRFFGNDGGSTITALTLDMSNGGRANFNNDIGLSDNRGLRLGSDDDAVIYNDGSNTYIKNGTSNQDIIFQGNDDGSNITALTLDMSAAGAATFNGEVFIPRYLTHAGDGNTFMQFPSADEWGVTTGGTAAISVDGNQITTFGGSVIAPRVKSTQATVAANSSSTALDFGATNNFMVNMTADTTFSFSNLSSSIGCSGNIILVQDATGGRDFTLPSEAKTPVNGATIVQNTGANEISVLSYYVMSSSQVLVNYIGDFA